MKTLGLWSGTLVLVGLMISPAAAQSWIGTQLDGGQNIQINPAPRPAGDSSSQPAGAGFAKPGPATPDNALQGQHRAGDHRGGQHRAGWGPNRNPWDHRRPPYGPSRQPWVGPPRDAGQTYDDRQDRNAYRYQQAQRWLDYERESALAGATPDKRAEVIQEYDRRQRALEREYDYRNDAARDAYMYDANWQRRAEKEMNQPFNWNYNTQWFWAPHDTGPRW